MRIHFNGAARSVTGSQYLIEVNEEKLLIDCGLFQGRRQDTYTRNLNFQFNPEELNAVILSHAHIDHSGNLPNLIKKGYAGHIYGSPPTLKLTDIMLQDSGHNQEADIRFVNKRRAIDGLDPVEPLYTLQDAIKTSKHFREIKYNQMFEAVSGVNVHLVDAGHILGSAAVVLDVKENGRRFRVWFSGDIGRENMPLLQDPVLPSDADYLVMECTYGNKPHRDPSLAFAEFRDLVVKTIDRGGKVIIPAFAVGRTQEMIYDLHKMKHNGDIRGIPVYVDSPLAVNASEIFQQYEDYFDEETRRFVKTGRHPALNCGEMFYLSSVEESKSLNHRHEPMVIISTSGMLEGGRILHHLRHNIGDPKSTILIVSWQAPNTLGRRLAEREKSVRIFDEIYERRAEVATIGGLSAHAGQNMLIRYALASGRSLKQIALVHGEPDSAHTLQQKLIESNAAPTSYPDLYEIMDI